MFHFFFKAFSFFRTFLHVPKTFAQDYTYVQSSMYTLTVHFIKFDTLCVQRCSSAK